MLNKFIAIASIATTAFGDTKSVATFADNDIVGTVSVDYGSVSIDLDLSAMPALINGFDNCTAAGLKYHIHELWTHSTDTEALASDCGSDYTGGHYDPWAACGSATGNTYCSVKGGCIDTTYSCDFESDPYSCEVGDWSSKYGLAELDGDDMVSVFGENFFEVQPSDILGMSVVFHCTDDGARAFCAKFEAGEDTDDRTPNQDYDEEITVMATFDALSDDSYIELRSDGGVELYLEITTDDYDSAAFDCTDFEYTIWTNDEDYEDGVNSLYGDNCESILLQQWDPSNQCQYGEFSSSDYCTGSDGELCDDSSYSYSCDMDADRFSCAPGDLSGKFGLFESDSSFSVDYDAKTTLIPPVESIVGASIAITCPYVAGETLQVLACAQIQEVTADIVTTMDGTAQISFIMASVVTLIALFLA